MCSDNIASLFSLRVTRQRSSLCALTHWAINLSLAPSTTLLLYGRLLQEGKPSLLLHCMHLLVHVFGICVIINKMCTGSAYKFAQLLLFVFPPDVSTL